MKTRPHRRTGPDAELARLRTEIRQLRKLQGENKLNQVHASHSKTNIMASGGNCQVYLDRDLRIRSGKNLISVLGPASIGQPVEELLPSADAAAFFSDIRRLQARMDALATRRRAPTWRQVYPAPRDRAGLQSWISLPVRAWRTDRTEAVSQPMPEEGEEHYLMSDRELIRPGDDFRVEYLAQAPGDISDLTLVVGTAPPPGQTSVEPFRPDRNGYSFVFGGIGNLTTELQRRNESIAANRQLRIRRNQVYRCVAERLHGQLSLTINGQEAYAVQDLMPIMEPDCGHVGFYAYGAGHRFWNPRVWTAPGIPADLRRLMARLNGAILRHENGPARFVEVHYLRPGSFFFKDVTRTVEQREQLEAHRRQAEKMEALLLLANAAAHEMNQPLTLMVGYLDMILQHPFREQVTAVKREEIDSLREATKRMADIVRKMTRIHQLKVKPYLGSTNILDLDASTNSAQKRRSGRRKA